MTDADFEEHVTALVEYAIGATDRAPVQATAMMIDAVAILVVASGTDHELAQVRLWQALAAAQDVAEKLGR